MLKCLPSNVRNIRLNRATQKMKVNVLLGGKGFFAAISPIGCHK
jgi:hypothetical protein